MSTVNELALSGYIGSTIDINGNLSNFLQSIGSISNVNQIIGSSTLPDVLDRTAIHYDTTEAWDSMTTYIAQKGHIYVYSDYRVTTNESGDLVYLPGIKIGDGTSYLIDMPMVAGDNDMLIDHINNWSIHVSANDRTDWSNKISASVNAANEELLLST